jgi:hypothetical protein
VIPPSFEYSKSALLFQRNVKRVMAILVGSAGSTAMLGSLPPAAFAFRLGSAVKIPVELAGSAARRSGGATVA